MIYLIFSSYGDLEENEVAIVGASTDPEKSKQILDRAASRGKQGTEYLLVPVEEDSNVSISTWIVELRDKSTAVVTGGRSTA